MFLVGDEVYGQFEQETHEHVAIAQYRLHSIGQNARTLLLVVCLLLLFVLGVEFGVAFVRRRE